MAASLARLEVRDFRCLHELTIEPHAGVNLILGANASGKTSLLEAIFVLGRGRSFRTAQRSRLVRDSAADFLVAGELTGRGTRVAVRGRRGEPLAARIGGEAPGSLAELSRVLPIEIIDPEVHKLVDDGPERRRRYLDWGTFHVEHRFLEVWGRYRRALRQRNALLQAAGRDGELEPWEAELAEAATTLTAMRRAFLATVAVPLAELSEALTDYAATIDFRPGFDADRGLAAVLRESRERDRALGRTVPGPHRAELVLELGDARARARVSRGQQKLLAASLVLAQLTVLSETTGRRPILLLDDPAAELDEERVDKLIAAVQRPKLQLFVTALHRNNLPEFADRTFHMKQLLMQ